MDQGNKTRQTVAVQEILWWPKMSGDKKHLIWEENHTIKFNGKIDGGKPLIVCNRKRGWEWALVLHVANSRDLLHIGQWEWQECFWGNTQGAWRLFCPHIPFKRHLLQQTLQASGETEDQFVCRLHLHTVACKFGTNEDDQICDQFTNKCFSSGLHREFLQKQGRNSFLTWPVSDCKIPRNEWSTVETV